MSAEWYPAAATRWARQPYESKETAEHIHRHCRRCGFHWNDLPIDTGASPGNEGGGT